MEREGAEKEESVKENSATKVYSSVPPSPLSLTFERERIDFFFLFEQRKDDDETAHFFAFPPSRRSSLSLCTMWWYTRTFSLSSLLSSLPLSRNALNQQPPQARPWFGGFFLL